METLLIGLLVALSVSRSLRHARERNTRIDGHYVSNSYRAKGQRAYNDKSARSEYRARMNVL